MDALPKDAVLGILMSVSESSTLANAPLVCKHWHGVSGMPAVWEALARKLYPAQVLCS